MAGRLVVRRSFAGFACHPCADEVKRIEWEERNMAKKSEKSGAVAQKKRERTGGPTLAELIDPMLKTGGMTVKEIAADVTKKAGEAVKGKDIEANIRARMVAHSRNGWQVKRDEQKRVKLVHK